MSIINIGVMRTGVQLTLSEVASPDAGIPPLNHAEVTVE